MGRKRVTIGQRHGEPITTTVADDDTAHAYEDMTRDPNTPDVLWVKVEDAE